MEISEKVVETLSFFAYNDVWLFRRPEIESFFISHIPDLAVKIYNKEYSKALDELISLDEGD